jgi:hypothetical protein
MLFMSCKPCVTIGVPTRHEATFAMRPAFSCKMSARPTRHRVVAAYKLTHLEKKQNSKPGTFQVQGLSRQTRRFQAIWSTGCCNMYTPHRIAAR